MRLDLGSNQKYLINFFKKRINLLCDKMLTYNQIFFIINENILNLSIIY